ncbi:response regulator [bacterium]|nr:response regulator [bacterium]
MTPTVLLIDNDSEYRTAVEEACGRKGFACKTCSTAKQAFALLDTEQFDAIVLEAMLEDISSGFRVARMVRERDEKAAQKQTAILLVSALKTLTGLDFSDRIEKDGFPVDRMLHKPVDPRTVADTLAGMIETS